MELKHTIPWGRVTEKIEKALIVASGPSAKEVDFWKLSVPKDVTVISVNGTLPFLPCATHWFSLDLSSENKQVMWEHRLKKIRFYAGAFEDYIRTEGWVTFLKRRLGTGPRNACYGLSEDPEWVATGNSAYGALGLAYLMRAKKVALIGVDGTQRYWYGLGGPSGLLGHLKELFASSSEQLRERGVEVLNGSPYSVVECFPRCKPSEAIDWISSK